MNALSALLGDSPEIAEIRTRVRRLVQAWSGAQRPPPVLIQGETGTGKGLLARAVHEASPRSGGPFVAVNCAALPETLLEAELFGYQRGAFTDARQAKPGLFHAAHRGTLFLDEVGLMAPALQAKLLSVLEERAVRRLGATRAEPVDVWVIAATNEDLAGALREQRFRQDLYHRLAVVTVALPPLRTRGPDILVLAEQFLARACADYGLPPKALAPDARAALVRHRWPGNVRELHNAIERAALLADATVLTAAHLALPLAQSGFADRPGGAGPGTGAVVSSRDALREHLERVLNQTEWNISRAAALLGVSRNTVMARIARFGLRGPRKAGSGPPPSAPRAEGDPPGAEAARWELRRLTFLRAQVRGAAEREMESAVARRLALARDQVRGFGGRMEGATPDALLAVFGLDQGDEPAVRAGHAALVLRNAATGGRASADRAALAIGLHTAEVAVRVGGGPPAADADASRRAWNALDVALPLVGPGEIVATPAAAAHLRRRFALTALGPDIGAHRLEGLWLASRQAGSARGPFVARREELALIESRLALAIEGRGQVVDIAGEAGIGKSRLLLELMAGSRARQVRCLEGHCRPGETNTPFAPLLEIVRSACGIGDLDPPAVVGEKAAEVLAANGLDGDLLAGDLGYLLGAVPDPPEASGPALTRRLLTTIQRFLGSLSARQPLLIAVEDLHWIDPTSDAGLDIIAGSIGSAAILLITTRRPVPGRRWAGSARALELTLPPLAAEAARAVIRGVIGAPLSADLELRILERAEGNPLFLEELSRAALERRGHGAGTDEIPATVEDAVAARLERLPPPARRLLAIGAAIGREVPLPLLREVAEIDEAGLAAAGAQLQRGDFVDASGFHLGAPSWTFKHALVQAVAHGRLPAAERRAIHARILAAIERLYPDRAADQAERLAHHAVMAEARPQAAGYLLLAGRRAAARSALGEAAHHLARGLELVAALPEGPERDRQELALQLAMGIAAKVSKGYTAPETERAYARALELSERAGDQVSLGPILAGQWSGQLLKAQYGSARQIAEHLEAAAERSADPLLGAVAQRALGMTALHEGNVVAARAHLERGLARYRVEAHHARALAEFGGDPDVSCLAYLGRALWSLGYPDQALARSQEAVRLARERGGAFDTAVAQAMLTSVHQLRREMRAVRETTEGALAHVTERGLPYWRARNLLLLSWAEAVSGPGAPSEAAIEAVRRRLEDYCASGTALGLSWFMSLLAQARAAGGHLDESLAALDAAQAHADATGERFNEVEIHLIRGDVLFMRADGDAAASAEKVLRRAAEIARGQEARGWELRAATRLARHLGSQGRREEARSLLAPIFGWFTEGHATADLRDARQLLEALGGSRP